MSDERQFSPACERNREPILAVLRQVLPSTGTVLEIASGTGMHAAWFGPRLPHLTWQPSDASEPALASIRAWRQHVGDQAFAEPVHLDVTGDWPLDHAHAIFCANMIHIAPWACALALLDGAARILPSGAPLVLYGPFFQDDIEPAPGNVRFDASLRARDPRWGVRHLASVRRAASERGLELDGVHALPANNRVVVFRRG